MARDLVPDLASALERDLAPDLDPDRFPVESDRAVELDPDDRPDREPEPAVRLEPFDVLVAVADANGSADGAADDALLADVSLVDEVAVDRFSAAVERVADSLVMMVFLAAALRARALRL